MRRWCKENRARSREFPSVKNRIYTPEQLRRKYERTKLYRQTAQYRDWQRGYQESGRSAAASRRYYYLHRTPVPARVELIYPYQPSTVVEGFDLLTVINNLVPRSLPEAVRGDVCQALALSVLLGEIETPKAEHVEECIREQFRFLPNRFHISLDADEYLKNRVGYLAAQLANSWGAALVAP